MYIHMSYFNNFHFVVVRGITYIPYTQERYLIQVRTRIRYIVTDIVYNTRVVLPRVLAFLKISKNVTYVV